MKHGCHRLLALTLTVALLLSAVGFLAPTDAGLSAAAALPDPPTFAPQTDANSLIGKTITGYQAWFGQNWYHQWNNVSPGRNRMFEMWPSVGDYPASALYTSPYGKLNNGEDAQLFNSTNADVIDTHFRWMQEYGIDGAAVQRFYGYGRDGYSDSFAYLATIRDKAEKYGRLFYMMYDMTGTGGIGLADFQRRIQNDFIYNIEGYNTEGADRCLVDSPAYAHADGKPVVCLWGLSGVEDSNYLPVESAKWIISWLQNRGYYVIVGTPDNDFSTVTDEYADVYAAADMISPWYVGRYNINGVGGTLRNYVRRDKAYCDERGIDFLPTIFPGFAWTNLKNVTAYNEIWRAGGQFLWREAIVLAMCGCETVYFSMFDEYDEATALMKAATDSTMIPAGDDYFLTLAADGYWLSDDFYLRLAGAIGDMMEDAAAGRVDPQSIILDLPVRYSEGPVYYRNGFTYYTTTVDGETLQLRLDPCVSSTARTLSFRGSDRITLTDVDAIKTAADGWIYRFAGSSTASETTTGTAVRVISDTNFELAEDTVLSYRLRAADQNGEAVYVSLLFEDGTLLDRHMISARETGAKAGEWVTVQIPISNDLAGRVVTAIVASCDLTVAGDFSADIDDLLIETGEPGCGSFTAEPAPSDALLGDVDGNGKVNTSDARLTLQYVAGRITENDLDLSVADADGNGKINTVDARLILQLAAGRITEFPSSAK